MKKLTPKPLSAPNGKVYKVQNKDKPKLSNAKDWYYGAYMEIDGVEQFLLFTEAEIKRAQYRTSRNEEDIVEKGWLQDFFD